MVVKFLTIASTLFIVGTTPNDFKPKWQVWESVPATSYLRINLFNVTNPDEFERGEKPMFEEIGPYVFKETRQHKGIVFGHDNSTVDFREVKTYEFHRSESVGSDDDLVTIVNLPLLSFGKLLSEVPYIGPNYFKSLVKSGETLTRRHERIGDVFYYGFEAQAYLKVLEALQGDPVPEQFSGGRFGLFKGRNGSDDGIFSIGTGLSPAIPFGKILSWKNESALTWWAGERCNALEGVYGELFDPQAMAKAQLNIFDPDACRSLRLSYHGKTKFQDIPAWKYVFAKDFLEDPRVDGKNLCYCTNPGDNTEKCLKKGVIDLSPCRNGAPLVLSYPHFLHGDESYLKQIGGMKPNKTLHNSVILVEPKTGTVLQDTKRFQLNVHMKAYPSLTYMKKMPELLLPVFWSEKIYTVNEETVEVLRTEIKKHPVDEDVDGDGSWEGDRSYERRQQARSSAGSVTPTSIALLTTLHASIYLLHLVFFFKFFIP